MMHTLGQIAIILVILNIIDAWKEDRANLRRKRK